MPDFYTVKRANGKETRHANADAALSAARSYTDRTENRSDVWFSGSHGPYGAIIATTSKDALGRVWCDITQSGCGLL